LPKDVAPAPLRGAAAESGLSRTRAQFGGKLKSLFSRGKVDDQLLEELEALLLTSDVGLDATQHLLYQLKMRAKRDKLDTPEASRERWLDAMYELLQPLEEALDLQSHTARSSS
jgi:fused signal recognition particle receptor